MPPAPAREAVSLPLLATAGFASMASMRLCDAMLPALAQDFGAAVVDSAGAVSAFAIAYGLTQLLYGPLGDRFGKARVIALAALACSAAAFVAAAAPSLGWLVASRALMGGTAAGIIPLTMAWVGDTVAWEQRQLALARMLSFTVSGMMAGAWLGGALADWVGWRWAFVAVGTLLAVVGLRVRARAPREAPAAAAGSLSHTGRLQAVWADGRARRVFAIALVEGGLVFGVMTFVPSLLHDRFALPLAGAGAVLALFGVGGLAYTRVAGWLLARRGAAGTAALGGGLLGAAFGGLAFMPHWGWALPACFAAGLGYYMLHGTLQTCATQLSDTARGTAVSLFACVLFIGQSAGVWGMSWAYGHQQAATAIGAAGAGLLALALAFAGWLRSAFPAREAGC